MRTERERRPLNSLAGQLCRRYVTRAELQRPAAFLAAACGESHNSDEQAHNGDFLGVHGSLRMSQVPFVAHVRIKADFACQTKCKLTKRAGIRPRRCRNATPVRPPI